MVAAVRRIVETDRWNSFDRFHDTTKTLVRAYEAAGATAEVYSVQTGGALGSGRWIIPEAADVRAATLDIVAPIRKRVLDYRRNPWHVAQWSASTAPGGVRCGLVAIDSDEQLARLPAGGLCGKFVLTRLKVADKRRAFYEKGALGVICDAPVPGFPDAVAWTKFGWGGLPLADSQARLVGLAISASEGRKLRQLLRRHRELTLRVNVDIRHYAGIHDVVSGIIEGRDEPQSEIWAIAHSSEPGALDNASGVAACVEIARVINELAASGALPRPRCTIRFVHAYECYGFFHYFEHHPRPQPPLAGVCIDIVGAKPALCRRELRWHSTIPMSATFVNDVGEFLLRAALRLARPGYRFLPKPFLSTEDTLLGDPLYGFPCPWLTNHPCKGYHSSADVPALLHARGLTACAAAMAGYLYYLAAAATDEALELAAWETDRTVERLREAYRQRAPRARPASGVRPDRVRYILHQHAASLERLRRWATRGGQPEGSALFAACARRAAEAAGQLRRRAATGPCACRPIRTAPLAPTAENTWPQAAEELKALPKWAAYWADGERTLAEIASLLAAELGRPVPAAQVLRHFGALAELRYVERVR